MDNDFLEVGFMVVCISFGFLFSILTSVVFLSIFNQSKEAFEIVVLSNFLIIGVVVLLGSILYFFLKFKVVRRE